MPDRLRAQQRALRQPRRARPLSLRGRVDLRTQQEARRMGISPQILAQRKETEKQRREQERRIKEHWEGRLKQLKGTPSVLAKQIAQIPAEHKRLLPKELLDVQKAKRERLKQFDERIKLEERRVERYRRRDEPRDYARYDEARETIKALKRYRGQENVSFSDAYSYARDVGRDARFRTSARERAKEQRRQQRKQDIADIGFKQEIIEPGTVSGQKPVTFFPRIDLSPPKKETTSSRNIAKALRNIFGF